MAGAGDATDLAMGELARGLRRVRAIGIGIALVLLAAGVYGGYTYFRSTPAGSGLYTGGGIGLLAGSWMAGGGLAGVLIGYLVLRGLLRFRGRALVAALGKRHGVAAEDLEAERSLF
jgi:hypothetical protein